MPYRKSVLETFGSSLGHLLGKTDVCGQTYTTAALWRVHVVKSFVEARRCRSSKATSTDQTIVQVSQQTPLRILYRE